ncbi:inositol monophosphatase [bacterium BFN5]|nr:inositol monophosphatase [bacterium BFN5]QJW44796.1 inositol monophosphatase [bacterium BFN5]
MIDLMKTLEKVKALALEVGAMQKANLGRSDLIVNKKSTDIDLVTEIDKRSEEMILDFLAQYFPEHAILAEESGSTERDSDYLWIIDPLDGTTNYSQGLPIFAVSIALQYRQETVLGVVYAPMTDQLFTAIRGKGAFLNGKPIAVSAKTELGDSVLATGFPYDVASHPDNNVHYFAEIVLKARAVRRFGAAAYDVASVAAGKFDGYWELKLQLWDVAAAILLLEEAGGRVIYFRDDRGISIIAANQSISEKIQAEIKAIDQKAGLTAS